MIETLAKEASNWNSGIKKPENISDLAGIVLNTMEKFKNIVVVTSESKDILKNLCLKFGVRVLHGEVIGFLGENRVLVDRKSAVFNYFLEKNVKLMPLEIDYSVLFLSYIVLVI